MKHHGINVAILLSIQTHLLSMTSGESMCRDSWVHSISPDEFQVYACSKCFVQVFMNEKSLKIKFPPTFPYLLYSNLSDPNATVYFPDAEAENSLVCDQFLDGRECRLWKECCQAAKHCCSETQQQVLEGDTVDNCPPTWDGVSCWRSTPGGQQQKQSCPSHYVMAHVVWAAPKASRFCEFGGFWRTNNNTMQEYSDYKECFDVAPNLHILRVSLFIDFIGNGTSIVFLVIATAIMLGFRELRVDLRQKTGHQLHFSLFLSVLCTSMFNIAFHSVYYDAFTNLQPLYENNAVWCRALHILTKYFKSTTYMCMFCEGLFLYRRISQVMQIGVHDSIIKYLIITWALPSVTVGIYVTVMVAAGHNQKCWMEDGGPSNYEFIHMIPNLCSLVGNLIFLLSIQYMLCTKMRSDTSDRRIEVLRHATRATMSLIPIFGLQFLFLIYRPKNWPPYEIIVAILESTLGLLVATLYCFTTRDVRKVLATYLRNRKERRRQEINQPIRMKPLNALHKTRVSQWCCNLFNLPSKSQPNNHNYNVDLESTIGNTCTYVEVNGPGRHSAVSKATQKSFYDGINGDASSQLKENNSRTSVSDVGNNHRSPDVMSYVGVNQNQLNTSSSIQSLAESNILSSQTEPLLEADCQILNPSPKEEYVLENFGAGDISPNVEVNCA